MGEPTRSLHPAPPSSTVGFIDEDRIHQQRRGLAAVGHSTIEILAEIRAMSRVLQQTLYFTVRGEMRWDAVAQYMYDIGNRSLVFVCVVMGFIGMILVYQAGLQTMRVVPDLSNLGATYLELLVGELGSTICALMLATRVGAGIAAEIGSMTVTEQVDALRMCAADPVNYLVKPRFVASVIMTVFLAVLASTVAFGIWHAHGERLFRHQPAHVRELFGGQRGRPHRRSHQVLRLWRSNPDCQRALRAEHLWRLGGGGAGHHSGRGQLLADGNRLGLLDQRGRVSVCLGP